MAMKKFTSKDGWYHLQIPTNWDEYEDDDITTHAFFKTTKWTGNLRISTLHWDNLVNEDKAEELLNNELQENKGAILTKMNEYKCVQYKKIEKSDNEELIIYYWIFGKNNSVFICSFTTDKALEQDKQIIIEVENIIKSIKVNY